MCQQEKMQQWMQGLLLAVFAVLIVISLSACTATQPELSNLKTRAGGELKSPVINSTTSSNVGRFHALVIGNQDYLYLDDLKAPRHDAEEVAKMLEQQYGFDVTRLFDATREQMMRGLFKLREKMSSTSRDDSLLIYYAGHGFFDDKTNTGYWQPTDAEKENNVNWIRSSEVTDIIIAAEQVRHFLVVADSCYAEWSKSVRGDAGAGLPESFSGKWQRKSRHALTSGAKERVPDVAIDGHSLFAYTLLAALRNNYTAQTILDGHKLFDKISAQVDAYIENHKEYPRHTPVYDRIMNTGDELGDFLFFPVEQGETKNLKKELFAALSAQTSRDTPVEMFRDNIPQSAPRIKNIKIVYNPSRLGLARQISEELQRNNFPAKLETFDTWNTVALRNGLTSRELPLGIYTLFSPVYLQKSIDDVSKILAPLLYGNEFAKKILYENSIIEGAGIDIDEALIVLK